MKILHEPKIFEKQYSKSDMRKAELLGFSVKKNDIVICTALIPGKKAPRIITEEMIKSMQPGSIVYDLAVEQGGNVAGSISDRINDINGVKVIGLRNILNKLPFSSSNLYANNLLNFLQNLYNKEKKDIEINLKDEIVAKTLVRKEN